MVQLSDRYGLRGSGWSYMTIQKTTALQLTWTYGKALG